MFGLLTSLKQDKCSQTRIFLALTVLETILMFVWSIVGTIALRNVILATLLVMLPFARVDVAHVRAVLRRGPCIVLGVLSIWILLHNLTLAWDAHRAWYESMQWFKSMTCLLLGVALACVSRECAADKRWRYWIVWACLAWALHLVLNLALKNWSISLVDALQMPTSIGSRDMISYLGTGLLAVLLADAAGRMARTTQILPLSARWLLIAVLATIVLTAATMTRNALPIMAIELAMTVVAIIGASATRALKLRRSAFAAAIMALVAVAFMANLMLDARWKNFVDSARIALDIEHNTWWIDQVKNPRPVNDQGVPVDHSTYNRIAWMRGISHLITVYPLGTGYDRNAFRRALQKYYGASDTASGHAHAGLFDFTLATGLPGGAMLIGAMLWMIVLGWRQWKRTHDAAGLVLALFATSYLLRAAIDGIVRDHMLEQAMFILGLLLAASTDAVQKKIE